MSERSEHQPDQINIALAKIVAWEQGKIDEYDSELDDLKLLRGGNVQTRGGKLIRIDNEIHHIEAKKRDLEHFLKFVIDTFNFG